MSKMSEIKKKQLQSYLSDDLIIQEILTRLPIKSIIRFKSVSKQWYSTLSSSDFANAHLMKSPFSHPSAPVNTLFITSGKKHYLFSYDDDQISGNFEDNLVKLDVDFGVGKDHLILTGCCNGLVCLTPTSYEYFIIWNPATRKLHKYASHGYLKHLGKAGPVIVSFRFGYASSVDDYKCVVILSVVQGSTATSNIVHVFSLRENRWRKIDFFHDPLAFCSPSVLVRDKLYWSAYGKQGGYLLVSFDLAVERFDVINIAWDKSDFLAVMGGCLSKCNFSETFTGDKLLHIMEPPVIVKSIVLPEELKLDWFSQMIGFTKTDKFFVTGSFSDETRDFVHRRTLGIVDTCTKSMQYRVLLRFNKFSKIVRYVPSLVSPFPIEKPSEA